MATQRIHHRPQTELRHAAAPMPEPAGPGAHAPGVLRGTVFRPGRPAVNAHPFSAAARRRDSPLRPRRPAQPALEPFDADDWCTFVDAAGPSDRGSPHPAPCEAGPDGDAAAPAGPTERADREPWPDARRPGGVAILASRRERRPPRTAVTITAGGARGAPAPAAPAAPAALPAAAFARGDAEAGERTRTMAAIVHGAWRQHAHATATAARPSSVVLAASRALLERVASTGTPTTRADIKAILLELNAGSAPQAASGLPSALQNAALLLPLQLLHIAGRPRTRAQCLLAAARIACLQRFTEHGPAPR